MASSTTGSKSERLSTASPLTMCTGTGGDLMASLVPSTIGSMGSTNFSSSSLAFDLTILKKRTTPPIFFSASAKWLRSCMSSAVSR
ncbi:hypothetical protein D3C72_2136890 [compost metagenome]